MVESHHVSREDAFLHVYQAVRRLMDSVTALAEQLEADPEALWCFDAERAGAEYCDCELNFDHAFCQVEALEEALADDLIAALNVEAVAPIAEALRYTKEALPLPGQLGGDFRILAEAVDRLRWAVDDLNDYCYQHAIGIFGLWGGYWFMTAALHQSSFEFFGDDTVSQLPVEEVVALLSKPPTDESETAWAEATEARNRWIYQQVMAGVKYPAIIRDLESKPIKWQRVSTSQGIKSIARKYADSHGLPRPIVRAPGRPGGK